MKKLNFTLLLVALMTGLYAQQGLHLGVQVTPKSPLIINQNAYGEEELEYRFTFGYAAGVEAGYYFTDKLGLFTGFQYSTQGQQYQDESPQSVIDREVKLSYWRVPLYFRFSSEADVVGFYVNAGTYFAFLNSAEISYQNAGIDLSVADASDRFKDTEVGFLGGLGAQIHFSEQFYGTAGLRFTYGFADMNTEDWQITNLDGVYDPSHNASLGINLGLAYVFDMD